MSIWKKQLHRFIKCNLFFELLSHVLIPVTRLPNHPAIRGVDYYRILPGSARVITAASEFFIYSACERAHGQPFARRTSR